MASSGPRDSSWREGTGPCDFPWCQLFSFSGIHVTDVLPVSDVLCTSFPSMVSCATLQRFYNHRSWILTQKITIDVLGGQDVT